MPVNFDRPPTLNQLPNTFRRQLRRLKYVNNSDETIPPFACMAMGNRPAADHEGVEQVWLANKPSGAVLASTEVGLNQSDIWGFNTATPCPKDQPGESTIDWPCQALFKPTNPTSQQPFGTGVNAASPFGVGTRCGPVDGKWWLEQRNDGPFSCRGHDLTNPLGSRSDLRTIWVSPTWRHQSNYGADYYPSGVQVVSSGGNVFFGGSPAMYSVHPDQQGGLPAAIDRFTSAFDAIYYFHWQGSLSSDTASRGAILLLTANYINSQGASISLPYKAMRLQDIEYKYPDGDVLTSQEHVSIGGILRLQAGESLTIRNLSASSVSVQFSSMSMFKVSDFDEARHIAGTLQG